MTGSVRSRLQRLALGLVAVGLSGGVLTACAASAGDLARASCAHVDKSLALFSKAEHTTSPSEAAALRNQAYLDLLPSIPIAAQAAYHDISWQALSTTLSEINRVPESELVPSLQAQCTNATNGVFDQPPPPSNPAAG